MKTTTIIMLMALLLIPTVSAELKVIKTNFLIESTNNTYFNIQSSEWEYNKNFTCGSTNSTLQEIIFAKEVITTCQNDQYLGEIINSTYTLANTINQTSSYAQKYVDCREANIDTNVRIIDAERTKNLINETLTLNTQELETCKTNKDSFQNQYSSCASQLTYYTNTSSTCQTALAKKGQNFWLFTIGGLIVGFLIGQTMEKRKYNIGPGGN